MAKLNLNDIVTEFASNTAINVNNQTLEAALENTLSRDGTGPNALNAGLDMNGNGILNVGPPSSSTSGARLVDISDSDATGAASATLRSDLGASTGSSLVGFLQDGVGAAAYPVEDKLKQTRSVKDFGAVGDGVTDDTAAIQAAFDTGENIFFPKGDYLCNNLTAATNSQAFYGESPSSCRIIKNANGPIVTFSGEKQQCRNLGFRGESPTPAFTGHNIVSSGGHFGLINCGSRYAYARALLATGSHVQILGSGDIWQTTDATANGYDIEIGISGTATLYHQLEGIYSSQATGGILMTDVGSAQIRGGEFGKLYIKKGTGPGGVNGGITSGCRILGDVIAELSSAIFVGNQLSTVNLTFAAGTSGCRWGATNSDSGGVFTNNGNGAQEMIRNIGTSGQPIYKHGGDTSFAEMTVTYSSPGRFRFSAIELPNNIAYIIRNAAEDADALSISSNVAGDVSFTNNVLNRTNTYSVNGTSSGARHQFANSSGVHCCIDEKGIAPGPSGTPAWTFGTGTPEGVVTAPVGALFTRADGGAGTALYVKESGTGNTGWVAK